MKSWASGSFCLIPSPPLDLSVSAGSERWLIAKTPVRPSGREKRGGCVLTHFFCLYHIGQNLVIWPHLAVRGLGNVVFIQWLFCPAKNSIVKDKRRDDGGTCLSLNPLAHRLLMLGFFSFYTWLFILMFPHLSCSVKTS